MRIITGSARGTKLMTLEGETTRPTAERAKEAVFSMIQFEIEGRRVLDLFAGSGQLGLEALSRGAVYAVMADKSEEAVAVIRKNVERTHMSERCSVSCADCAEVLRRLRGRDVFDIVFLDPPYRSGLLPQMLTLLYKYNLIKPSTVIFCESGATDIFGEADLKDKYKIIKVSKYGVAYITMLKPIIG